MKEAGFAFDRRLHLSADSGHPDVMVGPDRDDQVWIPVHREWRLNGVTWRLAGAQQGRDCREARDEQVLVWRSELRYSAAPTSKDDEGYAGKDRRYADLDEWIFLSPSASRIRWPAFPLGSRPLRPKSGRGRTPIAAHGNSSALIKYLDEVSEEDILGMNAPTGMPLVYELDEISSLSTASTLAIRQSRQGHGGGRQPRQGEVSLLSAEFLT